MLDALRDYPIEYVKTLFSETGDGVITGLSIELTDQNSFFVQAGIVKLDGEIYIVNKSQEILFQEQKNYVYLKINKEKQIDGVQYVAM